MDDPHAEVEVKPQLKPRGSVAEEEDPNLSQQLCKLWIKSARSTKADSVSMHYIQGHRAPTKENTLALITTDVVGKNTQQQDQIRI